MVENELRANVLLVDDNPANLMALETILAELGQHLVTARSGVEALRHLLDEDFAVIVLDVNMPDMSGFEAATLIRQRPRSRYTPIVFMTAISQSVASALEAYGLGAVDYIYTPVAREVIQAKVKVFVDLFRMNQTLTRQSEQLAAANEGLEQQLGEIQRLNRQLQATVEELDRDVAERKRAEAALRDREARLQVLRQIDRAILAAQSPVEIARVAARHVRQSLECEQAAVLLFEPGTQKACVLAADANRLVGPQQDEQILLNSFRVLAECQRGTPVFIEDLAALLNRSELEEAALAAGLRACVCIPLTVGTQVMGALQIARQRAGVFEPAGLELAQQIADSLAVAIHNARLHEQVRMSRSRLQSLSRRLVQIQEDERRAIARELHDEAGQALTALMVGLGLIERDESCSATIAARVQTLKVMTDDVMEELHRMAVDLRPVTLDKLGLLSALDQYVRSVNRGGELRVELTASGMDKLDLPIETETTLYRVVQEALTNVARHAQASQARVVLNRQESTIVALVADDGIGFDVTAASSSGRLGLTGMRERAEMLGGTLTIESAPGKGTTVAAEVPLSVIEMG